MEMRASRHSVYQQGLRTSRPSRIFRTCTLVAFLLAFSLAAAAIWSTWQYTQFDSNDWDMTHSLLPPVYKYFDKNRNAPAILAIRKTILDVKKPIPTCRFPTGAGGAKTGSAANGNSVADKHWTLVKKLTTWRGSVGGCLLAGTVKKGPCTGYERESGTSVKALAPVAVNRWRHTVTTAKKTAYNAFCVLLTTGAKYQD